MEIALIVAFVALIVIAIGFSAWATIKRRKTLAVWAAKNGLTFSDNYDYGLTERFPAFTDLQQGDQQYAYNVMAGPYLGRQICAFDYHYETYTSTKNGRQTHHHYFSAIIMESPLPLKPLYLRPESFFDKMVQFMGFDDINFESAEFSSRYHVSGPDRKWAYDVLHARAIEYMLAQEPTTIQFDRHAVLAFRSGCFEPEQFESVANTVCGLLDLLPKYVLDQQRLDATAG